MRDPETGKGARDPALFREKRSSGSATAAPTWSINLTAGMGGDWVPSDNDPAQPGPGTDMIGPAERLAHVEQLKPEICSLDCGTLNFGNGNEIYISTPPYLRAMAERVKAWGVKPELEVFDLGHVRFAKAMVEEGLIEAPPLFQICLGIPWGAEADTQTMAAMSARPCRRGPTGPASAFRACRCPWWPKPCCSAATSRVGLEDNLYLDRGVLASNGQLVERAVEIIERLGARVLSPQEARSKLGLRGG